jgi:hypothetical protein
MSDYNNNNKYQDYAPGEENQYYNDYGFPINPQHPQAQGTTKPQQVIVVSSPETSGLAVASLVVGILGLLGLDFCGAFIIGLICGHLALIKINFSQGKLRGKGLAIAGLILNYIPVVVILGMMLFSILIRGVATR